MRVVVKIGTSLIATGERVETERLRHLVDQLDLTRNEYIMVTSGAIACGMSGLGLSERPSTVPLMQACAAVGQSVLMQTYARLFYGKKNVAQMLLTSDDFSSPTRYRNLCNTLRNLLQLGVIPIVNENDSVSVRELVGAFGDNDELSALLANAVDADWLILLTNVDGFLVPDRFGRQRVLRTIRTVTPELEAACNGKSPLGRGGMQSKLHAAHVATAAGVHVVIANGTHPQAIPLALSRKVGTYFPPTSKRSGKSRSELRGKN
jgi:glutamate 5-kinase